MCVCAFVRVRVRVCVCVYVRARACVCVKMFEGGSGGDGACAMRAAATIASRASAATPTWNGVGGWVGGGLQKGDREGVITIS